ncbi:LptA/OstA family protein [Phascolarctobacterium sp.]|uniref:LptA/OstA family protein n=1 Tax=Phascolarctobacterium sp. TaxID=2049039 RepID=UPI00386C6BE7
MNYKKKVVLAVAAAVLSLGLATTAWATPGNFSVQADELEYNLQTGEGEAKGHVVLLQDGGKATSDYAKFNSKTKSGVLTGNVVADRGDAHIVCNEFIAHDENNMSAVGSAVITKEGKSLSADRVNYYKARNYAETVGSWARLTDVDGSVLNAAKIDYDMAQGVANAYGGVTINSDARNLTASADSAVYKTDNNGYVELIGNAKATQNGNSVAGDKLRLTNANVAVADGNVNVIYIPEKQPAVKEQDVEQASA